MNVYCLTRYKCSEAVVASVRRTSRTCVPTCCYYQLLEIKKRKVLVAFSGIMFVLNWMNVGQLFCKFGVADPLHNICIVLCPVRFLSTFCITLVMLASLILLSVSLLEMSK